MRHRASWDPSEYKGKQEEKTEIRDKERWTDKFQKLKDGKQKEIVGCMCMGDILRENEQKN